MSTLRSISALLMPAASQSTTETYSRFCPIFECFPDTLNIPQWRLPGDPPAKFVVTL